MTDETTQVHPTGQEGEPTQQDVTQLDQSTSEPGDQPTQEQQPDNQEGKDPNGWALKRIGELTRQRHEADRRAQEAERRAQMAQQVAEQLRNGDQLPEQSRQPQDIDELVERKAAEKAQQQELAGRARTVAQEGEKAFPDFQQAAQTLDALGITNEQVQALIGMEDAHKVIYALGKDPEEAQRILALPPLQQGRALERVANKAANPPARAVSNAPAPIRPVDGSPVAEKDPGKMSTEEWMKWRQQHSKTIV